MGYYKKTILLSNQSNYDKGMAILNIEKNSSGVFGSLKVFDFKYGDNLMLGICADGNPVVKQNVILSNNNVHNFKLNNDFDINSKIGCVLVEIKRETITPLVWGTNGYKSEYKNDIIHSFESYVSKDNDIMQTIKKQENKADLNDYCIQDNDDVINQLETEILSNETNEKSDLFESSDEEIEEIIDNEMNDFGNFFSLIKEQIDEMFQKFPSESSLETIIPESKWVKVNYDGDESSYVLGLIYNGDKVRYICYGVPGDGNSKPPEELKKYSQWVDIKEGGYWLMYQDAITGENIAINEVDNSA